MPTAVDFPLDRAEIVAFFLEAPLVLTPLRMFYLDARAGFLLDVYASVYNRLFRILRSLHGY